MDAAPAPSLLRYLLPADTFVRIALRHPPASGLRGKAGPNRLA